jgi:HD-like signal output (HDOD) protein
VAFKVEQMARSPDATAAQITDVLAGDPALAAAVLQLANSALFSRGQPVTSLAVAVGRIGMSEIARVAITAGVGATAGQTGALAPLRTRLWNRSLTTAHVSRALAKHRGIAVDEALLSGLLQPLGSIVASLCIDVFLRESPQFPAQPLSFWLRLVEMFRAEIGGLTAARWKLPPLFCDVLGGGSPDRSRLANPALFDVAEAAAAIAVIAESRGSLVVADLAPVLGLRDDVEREFVVDALARSGESISSFEEALRAPSSASSAVAVAEPEAQPCAEVWVVNPKTGGRYRTVGVAGEQVILEGGPPLPVSQLVSLQVEATPPLAFLSTTRSCAALPGGQAVRIVTLPFALNAETKSRWQRLLVPRAAD